MGFAAILVSLLFMTPSVLFAQSSASSGQIGGRLDPSGAAVAGVSGRSPDRLATRTSVTDGEGQYAVGPVPLGIST